MQLETNSKSVQITALFCWQAPEGQLVHVRMEWDGGLFKLFINGILAGEEAPFVGKRNLAGEEAPLVGKRNLAREVRTFRR